jgi:hypothetical protein
VGWCEGCLGGQWADWILVRWLGYFVERWVVRIVGWSVVRMIGSFNLLVSHYGFRSVVGRLVNGSTGFCFGGSVTWWIAGSFCGNNGWLIGR